MSSPPGPSLGPVHLRLRLATRKAHARIEGRLPLCEPLFDLENYRQLLAAFLGFYRPLEAALALHAAPIPGLQWSRRVKLPLLMRDLCALGLGEADVDAIVSCDQLPSLHNRARVMGCLYVLEGSTLGGQAIKRLLMDRFGTSVAEALAFFCSYDSEVGALWRSFLGCLESSGQEGDADDAANAATETFHMLESWLHQREVLS